MNIPMSEAIVLLIILVAVLGLLVLDGAGGGPVHRGLNKGVHIEPRGSHETDPFEKQSR